MTLEPLLCAAFRQAGMTPERAAKLAQNFVEKGGVKSICHATALIKLGVTEKRIPPDVADRAIAALRCPMNAASGPKLAGVAEFESNMVNPNATALGGLFLIALAVVGYRLVFSED